MRSSSRQALEIESRPELPGRQAPTSIRADPRRVRALPDPDEIRVAEEIARVDQVVAGIRRRSGNWNHGCRDRIDSCFTPNFVSAASQPQIQSERQLRKESHPSNKFD